MRFPLGPLALLSLLGLFLLPFVDFSCQGKKVATFTGYEVAFGKKAEASFDLGEAFKGRGDRGGDVGGLFGGSNLDLKFSAKDRTEGRPLVAAALIIAVLGGLLGFIRQSLGAWAGMIACVLFLVAQSDMQKELQEQQVALLVLSFLPGYWASLAAAAGGTVLCLLGGRK
ncbi:MAG: hypothetical protein ACAI34_10550 [Verrucomicrobium sp.]